MKKVYINFQNCYGIGKIEHEFDFTKSNSFLIYAPNGTMKTSLANTIKFFSEEDLDPPCDKVYPERVPSVELKFDGQNLETKDRVLVVNPDFDDYDASHKISNFLASKELKFQFDEIYTELDLKQAGFLKRLKKVSISNDCESEFIEAFRKTPDDTFIELLSLLESELKKKNKKYSFKYNDVFDKKGSVKKFLEKHQQFLDQYIESYKKLLKDSKFFNASDNSFGTYQASEILKSIDDNSFFEAGHALDLKDGKKIQSAEELDELVRNEIARIISDEELKSVFDKVGKAIDNSAELRLFKDVIEKDNLLLIELKDYEKFKQNVWLGFLTELEGEALELIEFYKTKKKTLEEILEKARREIDVWEKLVKVFNDRFYVPFTVVLTNQQDVLLKQDKAILHFDFDDNRKDKPVRKDKDSLLQILSKGEQRAYFLLQLLFDISSRELNAEKTLVVFDDIADSFDYKNKYAIIEYLKDLHESEKFRLLILTHNFDFYRTVASRLYLNREVAVLMATKKEDGTVTLNKGEYVKDLFRYFLQNTNDKKIFISLITFIRNIVEYTDGQECEDYATLTKCLHIKSGSDDLTCGDIASIWKTRFGKDDYDRITFQDEKVNEMIYQISDQLLVEADEILIENKITLSIAIRLKAEEFMIKNLEGVVLEEPTENQTQYLFTKYKATHPDKEKVRIIGKVILMTPENIHLNAFMYEPLVDISVTHLLNLYSEVKAL